MQGAVLILLLPVCCGMVTPAGPTPAPGCTYDGKHYRPGEVMHTSTEGDCVRTLYCSESGPIAGDSRGCFTGHKRADESDEPVPSSPVEVEENPEPAVNSTGQKRAEESDEPVPSSSPVEVEENPEPAVKSTGQKRADESDEPVPSSPVEVEENPEPAVNSTGQKRAEELNEPEKDTVDLEQATHNKPEERSELYNYNEIVRALNYDDNARALDYKED